MIKKMACCLTAVVLATGMAFCAHAEAAPAASVTINGVTTTYASLMDAWAYATNKHDQVDVYVKLLKDATVGEPLIRSVSGFVGWTMTLDLNDCVLAYAGKDDSCFIQQAGGNAMHIVDTATTRTSRYFTCDTETGLWKLSNTETDLTVSGGLITGGRAGATSFTYGSGMISNVNLVGNYSAYDGGAVSVRTGTVKIFNSTFLGNATVGNGGAVYALAVCEMTDCRVEANVAGKQGGGMYAKLHASLVRTRIVGNRAGTGGGGVYLTKTSACLAAGTKILMADGSEKNIENVVEGETVATFDHEGGTNASAAVCFAYSGKGVFPAVALAFASGATLTIIDRHDLLAEATRKYVTLTTENAADFVGARFYNFKTASWDELTGVAASSKQTAFYSLYAAHHLNCVANGLLTVPDDVDFYLNVYELDDSLKADADQLAADIEKFGLLDVSEYPALAAHPETFDSFNFRYTRIATGKGLVTRERLWGLFEETDFTETANPPILQSSNLLSSSLESECENGWINSSLELELQTPTLASVLSRTRTPTLPTLQSLSLSAPSDPYLQVGEGTVVTGNVTTAGADSNVCLDQSMNAIIDILPDATGVDVGVTLSSGAGIFGWKNAVNYAESFFADDPTYSVSYTADGELALRAGIRVGGDAWATVDAEGVCSISGTGDMWDMAAAKTTPLWGLAITNVVVSDGVTKVGAHVFEKMATVKDVSLASSVTNVGVLAFHKCYLLTNVVSAATGTMSVGDGAFLRCNSLERLHFDGEASFGREAYALQAGIRIVGGMPEIYPIPQIECAGYSQRLKGSNDLAVWQDITTEAQKLDYRFFMIVMEEVVVSR